jgi:hypothetical protein
VEAVVVIFVEGLVLADPVVKLLKVEPGSYEGYLPVLMSMLASLKIL